MAQHFLHHVTSPLVDDQTTTVDQQPSKEIHEHALPVATMPPKLLGNQLTA